ncbi:MAG: aquaporin [Gemmataceae bacterium]|nr:aquaporin [Gemmataceae bacterium]
MDTNLRRAYLIELLGTFGLVYLSAGVVCANFLTTPVNQAYGGAALLSHQPGLLGIALAQGLILAAMLVVTVPLSGGFLNPAVTLMLWVFNRVDSARASWLIGAQVFGAVLAGAALRFTFDQAVLAGARAGTGHMNSPDSLFTAARMGTPHLNPLTYPELTTGALLAGTGVELVLTFFLVFAIFGTIQGGARPLQAALAGGLTLVACALYGHALTGAALNPARWLGTALWEWMLPERTHNPFADLFVYMAGPIIGALLAGLVYFKLVLPSQEATQPAQSPARSEPAKTIATQVKAKK